MVTLGCIATPDLAPARFLPLARAAESAGLDELWLWEDCFKESGVAAAGAILGATRRLRVGIGILPVPLRNVALTAMELATLDGMFPGRLVPGIGHGVQDWMAQIGARPASPLTLLREHADALHGLLHGQRLTVGGRYVTLDDVALDWPPAAPPPVLMAGQGPRTLRLAGEVADGVVLTGGTTPSGVRDALALVEEGRAAAGRTDAFAVVAFVAVPPGSRARGAQACADRLRAWAEAGATTIAAIPLDGAPQEVASWLGQEVRPLL
ncbi:LLM class flavin-dependent oxidoreductase [Xylanimonas allomyrinae]|uniref:LLM class flavin-dependent oxidoreductase n=1 Tax=Xylanimonas allomyrinae TaxID=2509459 RepID=A0A4P6ETR3_9MICO|nr:LLM class flavin-dependent oxidoreductase [Xylanimonas allomyrinae]QAY63777.1 LLM class flavin-dependent oxidoreductase [Xylanimonas allomyrinae]